MISRIYIASSGRLISEGMAFLLLSKTLKLIYKQHSFLIFFSKVFLV